MEYALRRTNAWGEFPQDLQPTLHFVTHFCFTITFILYLNLFSGFSTTGVFEDHPQRQKQDNTKKRNFIGRTAQTSWKKGLNVDLHFGSEVVKNTHVEAHLCLKAETVMKRSTAGWRLATWRPGVLPSPLNSFLNILYLSSDVLQL